VHNIDNGSYKGQMTVLGMKKIEIQKKLLNYYKETSSCSEKKYESIGDG